MKPHLAFFCAVILLAALSRPAHAQDADPATIKDVKQAYRSLMEAIQGHDAEKVRACISIKDDADNKKSTAIAGILVALREVRLALDTKFPENNTGGSTAELSDPVLKDTLAAIDAGTVELDSEGVTLSIHTSDKVEHSASFRQIAGVWKIAMDRSRAQANDLTAASECAKSLLSLKQQIDDGKFADAPTAAKAISDALSKLGR